MACILKFPVGNSRGVLTITDRERDAFLQPGAPLRAAVERLSDRWAIGLHHNWHDLDFQYDPLFAFSMAGEHDLKERDSRAFFHLPMDAANFSPPVFTPSITGKHWDLLFVGRAVFFKDIPELFAGLRALLDVGCGYRTLIVCPIPDSNEPTNTDVEALYQSAFPPEQQPLINLLTFRYRYPFPLDFETLAFFYRSSRAFVYFAGDERRPRNVAYAWASGLPVIAKKQTGLMLPESVRRPPYFFEFSGVDEWLQTVPAVLQSTRGEPADFDPVRELFALETSRKALCRRTEAFFAERRWPYEEGGWATDNLGVRIARHHGLKPGPNGLNLTLAEFLEALDRSSNLLFDMETVGDPESEFDKRGRVKPSVAQRPSFLVRSATMIRRAVTGARA